MSAGSSGHFGAGGALKSLELDTKAAVAEIISVASSSSFSISSSSPYSSSTTKMPSSSSFSSTPFSSSVTKTLANGSFFSVGVIADLQYVDDEDGYTYDGTTVRRYRQSLDILMDASAEFARKDVALAVQLGDVVDAKTFALQQSERDLQEVLQVCTRADIRYPWYFCIGNHDLASLTRERICLLEQYVPVSARGPGGGGGGMGSSPRFQMGGGSAERLYHDFSPFPGFRFIFLDPYDVSTVSASNTNNRDLAERILLSKNPNLRPHSRKGWFDDLEDQDKRYVPYNGQLGEIQFTYLSRLLAANNAKSAAAGAAVDMSEKLFIFCHLPIFGRACKPSALMWSSERVLDLLLDEGGGHVVAWISGHDHEGGYAFDNLAHIHHITPCAPLECAEGQVAYGTLDFFVDHCKLEWTGKTPETSFDEWPRTLSFKMPLSEYWWKSGSVSCGGEGVFAGMGGEKTAVV